MKLSVPAATIVAMALYSKSAAAFSISKQQLGRHAAKIIGATAYLSNTPFQLTYGSNPFNPTLSIDVGSNTLSIDVPSSNNVVINN